MVQLRTFENTEALICQVLDLFGEIFPTLRQNEGIMLAGGRTPLEIYRRAAEQDLTTNGQLFLSDERYVPQSNPQSNCGTISKFFPTLLPVQTHLPIKEAAETFGQDLSQINRIPLGLLGLGTDGHTASLFNLKDASLRDERLAIPVIKPEKPDRISVTPTLLNRIDRIIILATGEEKAEMIRILQNRPETIPAGVVLADHPHTEIWTDQSSA